MGDWRDATKLTIERIQDVFALNRDLELADKIALYQQAHTCVVAQGRGNGNATEYWNTFVNTLRTLVAGAGDCDTDNIFDEKE